MSLQFGPRRAVYIDITDELETEKPAIQEPDVEAFETFDLVYRSLCAVLYNYVPMSGHPGGSISSGRFVEAVLFDAMDYDTSHPTRRDADMISYSAGHKALGLYAMWALRDEILMLAAKDLLPENERFRLRIEDLLGFRRNPTTQTPLFQHYHAKALDGHPTPSTPFVRLSTGASGVGVGSSLGLAFAAKDYYGKDAPRVHIIEGEGGLTPGRVSEAMAAAGTASLDNAIMHVDWNQASIDSERVCRDGETPGEYVQWTPMELAYLHDWNAILVPDGTDFRQIVAAQHKALSLDNGQPTAIVYRTTKGWKYGVEGKASHGAGHKLCCDGYFEALSPLLFGTGSTVPRCESGLERCRSGGDSAIIEECFWHALMSVRTGMDKRLEILKGLARRLRKAKRRLDKRARRPRENAPNLVQLFETAETGGPAPPEVALAPGTVTTLRGQLGSVLRYYNQVSDGAILAAAADLLNSTSIATAGKGFAEGYYNARTNPESRLLSIGGICEDAMSSTLSGLSSYGRHMGVGSSYGAFIAPLGHIASRLHAIGNQARQALTGEPYSPFMLVCAHAGVKTGEDGPTHADPQALQLLQENFPNGTAVTLTPWEPQEMWPLVSAALAKRPAIIAPFVTRPNETVLDREALGLAPADDARTGVYLLRRAKSGSDGTLVLQGSEVAYAFVRETLPLLEAEDVDLDVYYIASAELFDMLSPAERERIFPSARAEDAMGITGFTLPTMYRWIRSERGRECTLHPFRAGHYLGSGQADKVLHEAGLDGEGQFVAIMRYVKERVRIG